MRNFEKRMVAGCGDYSREALSPHSTKAIFSALGGRPTCTGSAALQLLADVDISFSRNCCWQLRGRTMALGRSAPMLTSASPGRGGGDGAGAGRAQRATGSSATIANSAAPTVVKAQILSVKQSEQDDRLKVLKSAVSTVTALKRLLADYDRLQATTLRSFGRIMRLRAAGVDTWEREFASSSSRRAALNR